MAKKSVITVPLEDPNGSAESSRRLSRSLFVVDFVVGCGGAESAWRLAHVAAGSADYDTEVFAVRIFVWSARVDIHLAAR